MNILDQIIRGIHETKYQYAIRHAIDSVRVVVLIPIVDYYKMLNDMRTYLYEYHSNGANKELRVHGSVVVRTTDLEEGDIRFLVELPQ